MLKGIKERGQEFETNQKQHEKGLNFEGFDQFCKAWGEQMTTFFAHREDDILADVHFL